MMAAMSGSHKLFASSRGSYRPLKNALILSRLSSSMRRSSAIPAQCRQKFQKSTNLKLEDRQKNGCCRHYMTFCRPLTVLCVPKRGMRVCVRLDSWMDANQFKNNDDQKREPVKFSKSKDHINGGKYTGMNILMPLNFPVYVFPNLRSLIENALSGRKIQTIDKDLVRNFSAFVDSSQQAVFVIANLLSERKIDELEELFTPEAFQLIKENHVKIPNAHREALGIEAEEVHIPLRHIHRIRIHHGGGSVILEMVLLFEGVQKHSKDEKLGMFTRNKDRDRYCCTVKFERRYQKVDQSYESDEPWKVSGISYVIRSTLDGEMVDYCI